MRNVDPSNPNLSGVWAVVLPNVVAYSVALAYGRRLAAVVNIRMEHLTPKGWKPSGNERTVPMILEDALGLIEKHPEAQYYEVPKAS